jgi:hypothetical protein
LGLPSRFFEKKIVKDEKGDDITPFDGNTLHGYIITMRPFKKNSKDPYEAFAVSNRSVSLFLGFPGALQASYTCPL